MSTQPKLIIQIVTYNSLKFLNDCLQSIFAQTFKDFQVLIIDNHSTDGTLDFLKKRFPAVSIFRNFKNVGFAKAHNQGFVLRKSDYVLVLNPDVILEPDFLEKLLTTAENKKRGFSFGGKLLKIKSGNQEIGEKIKTKIIDSTGLKITPLFRAIDRGEGEIDKGQYDLQKEVFGISGACVLYRKKTLKRIGFFDESFFAYKEDVDLAWRSRLYGLRSYYVPAAIAYHYRGAAKQKQLSQNSVVTFYSFRNGIFLLLKNVHWQNFIFCFPLIFTYQFIKAIYLLFFRPKIFFEGVYSLLLKFPLIYRKRQKIFRRAKMTAWQFRKKFFHCPF